LLLKSLGFESFVKTTGGKGVHVVVPLERKHSWDEVTAFARAISLRMMADEPSKYVATMFKDMRSSRIFVDYLRNARGATAVAPYSTRARPDATVSTPVRWTELAEIGPDTFSVKNLRDRLRRLRHDPWEGFSDHVRQSITTRALKQLGIQPR